MDFPSKYLKYLVALLKKFSSLLMLCLSKQFLTIGKREAPIRKAAGLDLVLFSALEEAEDIRLVVGKIQEEVGVSGDFVLQGSFPRAEHGARAVKELRIVNLDWTRGGRCSCKSRCSATPRRRSAIPRLEFMLHERLSGIRGRSFAQHHPYD